jgi:Subtilase family
MSVTPHPVRLLGTTLAAVCCAAFLCTPVLASELPFPSQQRVSDRGAFLTVANPPVQPAGLCIIDSGVDLNPDLQPVVLDREALEGGSPEDVAPDLHGTRMAMEAAAIPGNDWGMVGAAPGAVRIVSIRATNTADALSFTAYKQAMLLCEKQSQAHDIKVISLAVGFQVTPTPEQMAELQDAIQDARDRYGIDVVAAAGNEASTQISYPAAAPGVIAVGASNAQGEPCSFSNTGPQLAVLAPGCDLEEANPLTGEVEYDEAGTSFAESDDAAVLAALRAYRPELNAEEAETLMRNSAAVRGGVLDVTSLFDAAGLQAVVASGEANEPKPVPIPTTASVPVSKPALKPAVGRVRLARPRLRIRRRGKTLLVSLLNLPRSGRVGAIVLGPRLHGHRHIVLRISSTQARISVPAIPHGLLMVTYTARAGPDRASPATYRGL